MTDRTRTHKTPKSQSAGARDGSVLSKINDPAPRPEDATGGGSGGERAHESVLARINDAPDDDSEDETASVKATAEDLAATARETARAAGERAAEMASEAAATARQKAAEAAQAGKETVAGRLETTAQALDDAASEAPDGTLEQRAMDRASESVQAVADRIRSADLGAMVGEVEQLARRHPVLLASAAAVAGFAVARMLKASSRRRQDDYRYGGSA